MSDEIRLIVVVLAALAVAFAISFAATPFVGKLAKKIGAGAMDDPKRDGRRMHTKPIARIGGLAIFAGFLAGVLIFADIDAEVRGILYGLVIIVVLGFIDDITPLPALLKFVVQIGAAIIPVIYGVRIEYLTNPNIFAEQGFLHFSEGWSIVLAVIWIVAITNSVNFIDGLDGLAVGVSSISAISMLIIAMLVSEPNVAVIMAALAGACIGFMPYNLNPAKIFMGDVGATSIGYILACISIQGLFKFYAVIGFAVPFLVLALPIFDEVFAIIRRLLKGKSPMSPDRGHVHHRLIDMGFNQKQAVAIMYTMSGVLGLVAVVLTASGEVRAMIILLAFIIVGFIAVTVIHRRMNSDAASDGEVASNGEVVAVEVVDAAVVEAAKNGVNETDTLGAAEVTAVVSETDTASKTEADGDA